MEAPPTGGGEGGGEGGGMPDIMPWVEMGSKYGLIGKIDECVVDTAEMVEYK